MTPSFKNQSRKLVGDPYLLILALLPIFVLWRDTNPIFTATGWIDPWVYTGYFHNLAAFKAYLFPNTYYGSRLSWLLFGFTVNKLFSPVVGNYVLHLTVFYGGVFALYSLLKTATNRRNALLGALMMGCYPYFWAAVGWDYADGAGITLYLITMVLLTRASAGTGSRVSLAAGGVTWALLVYSNLAWILLSPLLLLYFLIRCGKERGVGWMRALLEMGVWFGLGIALVTLAFCVINHALDGTYWFYAPSLGYALGATKKKNPWKLPIGDWVMTAHWLALPFATVVLSLITALHFQSRFFTRKNLLNILFVGQFLGAAGILLWADSTGDPLLQYPYYVSYLIPFMFLVIGAQFIRIPELGDRQFLLLATATLIVLALPWWGLTDRLWSAIQRPVFIYGLGLLGVCAVALVWGRTAGLIVVLAAAGTLFSYIHFVLNHEALPANTARGSFTRISHEIDEIEKVRQWRPIRFWYDLSDPFGKEFYSLNATYLWGYTMINTKFPTLAPTVQLPLNSLLVVPSSFSQAREQAIGAYQREGEILNPVGQMDVAEDGGKYHLYFFEVIRDAKQFRELTVSFDQSGVGKLAEADSAASSNEIRQALPMDRWQPCIDTTKKGRMANQPDGIHVQTAPIPWVYSTIYPALTVADEGKYRFMLRYKMISGHMYFGVQNGDMSGWLTGATVAKVSDRTMEVDCMLTLHRGEKVWLLTTNAEPKNQSPAAYVIEDLHAYRQIER